LRRSGTRRGDLRASRSNQPEYEVRQVALQVEGEERPLQVWYRHSYAMDAVDVIAVTNR